MYNLAYIIIRSYSDSKFFKAGYELDLDTMKKQEIPYGTIYANGFKLRTLMRNDSPAFDWKQYEVFDGTTTRTISAFELVYFCQLFIFLLLDRYFSK